MKDFERSLDEFLSLGVDVVGVSTDAPAKNDAWATRLKIRYPLFSDVQGQLVKELGIKGMLGRARRTTFLVDASGAITRIWEGVKIAGHAETVLEAARAPTV